MQFSLFVFAVLSADSGIKNEGDSCDANGVNGVCRHIRNCLTAFDELVKQNPPSVKFLFQTCGFDNGGVLVCCKSKSGTVDTTTTHRADLDATTTQWPVLRALTTTVRPIQTTTMDVADYDYQLLVNIKQVCEPLPLNLTTRRTGNKARDKCIEYQDAYVYPCEKGVALDGDSGRVNRCHHNADELIIGPNESVLHEFPHMVSLGYQNNQKMIDWECSGALISNKFVLTAGHCISNKLGNYVSHALIGVLKHSEANAQNQYSINRILKHNEYQPPYKYHDIALLEIDGNVRLSSEVVPACLHTREGTVGIGRAVATGWDTIEPNGENKLQKRILRNFPNNECSSRYETHRELPLGVDVMTQMCYGSTPVNGACQRDIGGILQVKNKKIVCMYTVIGVSSISQGCGFDGVSGIYTRVSSYLPWIESVVWPN